ncbi:MAG: 2-amino-4-hydroxy-6-hydroxymethyldihydropteridine diphosphokinase [Candidatus Omnitrophica bacterium]|nr:2-amino-4-hydroxy-6-hydroxymethyldihydropteridine diphosphokinase [Candidatus Omnitrophota bacterium]MDE2221990.1 2-amino-4-hydroxy-6-hydroxymethyldihydropteridine diphosphokinase [Candidatus Omnitrophota bacterium]
MAVVYFSLGSNLGDRRYYIHRAVEELKSKGLKSTKLSRIIETEPFEAPAQGKFLNAVLKAVSGHSPEELLEIVQDVERKLGRAQKSFRGPRVIDIDILFYDDVKLTSPRLLIPHPRMLERDFVMSPLEEIAPHLCASLKL